MNTVILSQDMSISTTDPFGTIGGKSSILVMTCVDLMEVVLVIIVSKRITLPCVTSKIRSSEYCFVSLLSPASRRSQNPRPIKGSSFWRRHDVRLVSICFRTGCLMTMAHLFVNY